MRMRRIAAALAMVALAGGQPWLQAVPEASAATEGRRQSVFQRTYQYSKDVKDLQDVRDSAAAKWSVDAQHEIKSNSSKSTAAALDKCGGWTTSSCGLACCGKDECEQICDVSKSSAHGNSQTCLDPIQTSSCGRSCCGALDCEKVCINYNWDGLDTCGYYTQTSKGIPCCGKDNCHDVECGYETVVEGDMRPEKAGIACCGATDCTDKECDSRVSVDSNVHADQKGLACCGAENCHSVACDGYTSTNTPTGIKQCCGYENCRYLECEGVTQINNDAGKTVSCCGYQNCMSQSLMLTSSVSEAVGKTTVKFVASGGAPGVQVKWTMTGSGHIVSSSCAFDSTGHAILEVETDDPYDRDLNVTVQAYHKGLCPTCKWGGTFYNNA